MSDLPTIGSVWEWNVGIPLNRGMVQVIGLDPSTLSIMLDGSPSSSFPQVVSLEDFLANAVPPVLKHR